MHSVEKFCPPKRADMSFLAAFAIALLASQLNSSTAERLQSRIINGQDAYQGQLPYQAHLVMRSGNGYFVGAGSLIGAEWVLTAAHVIAGIDEVTVKLGSIERDSPEVQITVSGDRVIVHPGWNSATLKNDIGLIRIPPVSLTDRIQPVELPQLFESSDFAGETGIISGWGGTTNGSPDILQYATITILSNEECAQKIGTDPTLICGSSEVSGICGGDSGGPLVLESDQILVGVTSFTVNGCESGLPNGYTRVTSYLLWIKENTGIAY